MILNQGIEYFNPDEAANRILAANAGISRQQANSVAWEQGRGLLQRAIEEKLDFRFETTLGGRTIPSLLEQAASVGAEVRIWYVGLESVNLHIDRVKARVARGGHDIPEQRIRERYDRSRLNLIELLPKLAELRLYDNSENADPETGATPQPKLILHLQGGRIVEMCELGAAPDWTKPILVSAMKIHQASL